MSVGSEIPWRVRVSEAASDREKGASEVALMAARALLDGAQGGAPKHPLSEALSEVVNGQRAMAPILRLVCDLAVALETGGTKTFLDEAVRWVDELESSSNQFCDFLMQEDLSIGRWIFFSYSATVLTGMKALSEKRMMGEAIVGEASPGSEGIRLAKRLAEMRWSTSLVPDTRLFDLVAQNDADLIILGCDACDAKQFVNKTGSAGLAAAAKRRGIPVELWTTTHKILPPGGLELLDLSAAQGSELKIARDDITIDQPLFGYGLLEDVALVRTERGVFTQSDVESYVNSLNPLALDLLRVDRKA